MATGIPWATDTWNPVTGCTPVSPGCEHCYAKRMSNRLAGRYGYPGGSSDPGGDPFRPGVLHADKLDQPLHWRKPRRIFVCSMGDLFHEDVPDEFIDKIMAVMGCSLRHTYMLLTKRPERMQAYFASGYWGWPWGRINDAAKAMRKTLGADYLPFPAERPFRNVQLGVTAENQAMADERVPVLLSIPAAVRFVSCEPLLERMDLDVFVGRHSGFGCGYIGSEAGQSEGVPACPRCGTLEGEGFGFAENHPDLQCLGCVIAGCESGPRRRASDSEWFRSLRDQCSAAGVPFFLKQMDVGGRVVEMPELDGVVHDALPAGAR